MTKLEFHKAILSFQPHEIISIIFDYFACALLTAPPEKVEDFFVHFREGVVEYINFRQGIKKGGT